MVITDPVSRDGRGHVLVADLGNDTLYRYDLDAEIGKLAAVDTVVLPQGTGARHLVVQDRYAYVARELASTTAQNRGLYVDPSSGRTKTESRSRTPTQRPNAAVSRRVQVVT